MKKIFPICSLTFLASLTVSAVDLPKGYNTWSGTEGLKDASSAAVNFYAGDCGLRIDMPNKTITNLGIPAGNWLQVSKGYIAEVKKVTLLNSLTTSTLFFGTSNEDGKDTVSGTLNIDFENATAKVAITANSGTVNILKSSALGGRTYTANKTATINFKDEANTGYITFNNGSIVADGGTVAAGTIVVLKASVSNGGTIHAYGGMRIVETGSNIDGNIIVESGQDGSAARKFTLRFGNGTNNNYNTDAAKVYTIGANATILQYKGVAGFTNDFLGDVRISAATGALKFQNALNLSGKGKITLNTSNAFAKVDASGNIIGSQKDMTLQISTKALEQTLSSNDISDTALIVKANNEFGGLALGADTTFTLDIASGIVFSVGKITTIDNNYSFILDNFDNNSLRITNMTKEEIEKLTFYEKNGNDISLLDFSVDNAVEGGFWVNSAAVPEPAEYATIFGCLAWALAVYRRRK